VEEWNNSLSWLCLHDCTCVQTNVAINVVYLSLCVSIFVVFFKTTPTPYAQPVLDRLSKLTTLHTLSEMPPNTHLLKPLRYFLSYCFSCTLTLNVRDKFDVIYMFFRRKLRYEMIIFDYISYLALYAPTAQPILLSACTSALNSFFYTIFVSLRWKH